MDCSRYTAGKVTCWPEASSTTSESCCSTETTVAKVPLRIATMEARTRLAIVSQAGPGVLLEHDTVPDGKLLARSEAHLFSELTCFAAPLPGQVVERGDIDTGDGQDRRGGLRVLTPTPLDQLLASRGQVGGGRSGRWAS
ncbi:MAG: hypothetical protein ACYDB3_11850 [Acidimicrobiales bacterium]